MASKTASNVVIALVLLYQLAMPLRYYLGERGSDERFSWRMFSTVRLQKCSVQVDETVQEGGERRVDLSQVLQIAWLGMLERNRPQVVEKLLARRCQESNVQTARYRRSCIDTDGTSLPTLTLDRDCASGNQKKQEGPP